MVEQNRLQMAGQQQMQMDEEQFEEPDNSGLWKAFGRESDIGK